ncbi:MAG: efflux RND transporter periplasmic adaptor subunit [Zoogloea sp.]|nr:efflux RND transporter periplasmic adaptor subunit [Zoogloea sp.]
MALAVLTGAMTYITVKWYGDGGYVSAPVSSGVINLRVSATGRVRAKDQQPIFPRVNGQIKSVQANFQGSVKQGDVLAVIDDKDYRIAQEEADSTLASVGSEIAGLREKISRARLDHQRNTRLYQADLIPRQEMDNTAAVIRDLETQLQMANSRQQQARLRLEQAKKNLDACEVRSPINGYLLSGSVDVGSVVAAGGMKPLFEVAPDLGDLLIRVSVTESDIGRLKVGQQVKFTVEAYPGEEFSGTLAGMRRGGEERGGLTYYEAEVQIRNADHRLLPGMSAQVKVEADRIPVKNMMPIKALLYNPGDKVMAKWQRQIDDLRQHGDTLVWVTDKAQGLHPIGVQLGVQDNENVEVKGTWPQDARVVVSK